MRLWKFAGLVWLAAFGLSVVFMADVSDGLDAPDIIAAGVWWLFVVAVVLGVWGAIIKRSSITRREMWWMAGAVAVVWLLTLIGFRL